MMRVLRLRPSALAVSCGLAAAIAAGATTAAAQQQAAPAKPPRAGQTIVIHGQVPTPQVVTVRPREVPAYDRQALGAAAERGSFWSSAMPGYELLSRSQVTGRAMVDSATARQMAAGGAGVNAPAGAAVGTPAADLQARTQEMEAIRRELAQRRARLDSLERAERATTALGQTADSTGAAAARPRMSAADSAARAAEIAALMKELEYRKARLDSLQAVVQSLGRPRDSTSTRPDSTPPRHQ